MFNKVIIVGNLTRDVELRYLPSGSALATIGLASNRKYKKQDGSNGEEVCFVDVKLFGRSAEVANQYLKKGSSILIEGRLTLESWNDQSGQKRTKHTITAESMQMLGKAQGDSTSYSDSYEATSYSQGYKEKPSYQNQSNSSKEQPMPEIDINEDEIPF